MAEFSNIQSTLENKIKRFNSFVECGVKYREWLIEHGYVYTNYGFLKGEWIHMGKQLKAISHAKKEEIVVNGKKLPYYILTIEPTIKTKTIKEGTGRKHEKTVDATTTDDFDNWEKYINTKRDTDTEHEEFCKVLMESNNEKIG